jgi:predicted transcriptional regulator
MRTAHAEAERLIAEAPSLDWLREVADELDRAVRTSPLERLTMLWGLSNAEAARMFGVSRQAFSRWLANGIPSERAAAVADLDAATNLLSQKLKRERIPAVVRRTAPSLMDKSLYQIACEGRHREVRDAVTTMFDLQRIQP